MARKRVKTSDNASVNDRKWRQQIGCASLLLSYRCLIDTVQETTVITSSLPRFSWRAQRVLHVRALEGGQQRERREERADAEREKKSSPLAVILDWCASRQMSLFDRIDPMGKKGRKRGCRVRFKKYGALTRLLKEGF